MVSYNIPTNSHVFVFTDGVLKEVTIKRIIFHNWAGCDELQTEFRIESDTLNGRFNLLDMYDSVEDYLVGKWCDNITVEPFNKENYENCLGINGGEDNFWYIEDDQVKYLDVSNLKKAYYDYEKDTFYSDEFKGREFFPTKEYASKFLDVEVNKADGTIERAKGINRLLLLDSDQRKLIKQLKEIVDKINESDILLYSDCDGNYFAYNTRELEDFEITDDDRWIEQQHGCTYECSGEFAGEFEVDLSIPCNGREDLVYAKRKK